MTIFELFWLFFLIAALQPVIKQRLLVASRQRVIGRIEQGRGSRVILLVHRQETMSLLGFPVFRYIDIDDAEAVMHAINLSGPDTPLDLVLHTPGGLALPSSQIARAINRRRGKVTVFVPHYAMSGGTLIALAADEIVMCEHAVLGPLDPQIGQYPAASLLNVVRNKPIEHVEDNTLILADQAEKAMKQLHDLVHELLREHYPAETVEQLSDLLTQGIWTHDYAITYDEAQRLGLNVSAKMPAEFLDLMNLFPQPIRRTPSVEYTPRPSGREPSARKM